MKNLLFILIITAVWGNLSAQLKTYKYHDNTAITQRYRGEALSTGIAESKNGDSEIGVIRVEEEKPYDAVEQMPTFPGGEAELMKFIRENLKYPLSAQKEGIQGRVILRFVVSKTGSIENITILRSLDPACDEEAIRLIKRENKTGTPSRSISRSRWYSNYLKPIPAITNTTETPL